MKPLRDEVADGIRANQLERAAKIVARFPGGVTAAELWRALGAPGDVGYVERSLLQELNERGEAHFDGERWLPGPGPGLPALKVEAKAPAQDEALRPGGVFELAPRIEHKGSNFTPPGRMVGGRFVVGAAAQDDGAAGERAGADVPLSGWSPEPPADTRTEGEVGVTAPSAAQPVTARILEILRERPGLTAKEVHEALGRTKADYRSVLQLLDANKRKQRVRAVGSGTRSLPKRWYLVSPGGPGMPSARASAEARGFSAEPATAGAPSGAGTRPGGQQTGYDRAPIHYDGGTDLEAIDAIWRNLRTLASDEAMVGFCVGNALKYESRAGRKTDGDLEKARWYWSFAAYVRGEGPDPRTARPGWVPHPDAPRPLPRRF